MNKKIYSVSEMSKIVQETMDDHPILSSLWVRGEIANFKCHSSGHLYFSLKDQNSNVRAVMFKSRALKLNFKPKDGLDCLVRGYVSVYAKETSLQLYVEEILPSGIGLQSIALAELKERLQKKGYFANERKKDLPLLPIGIGVVSSPVGAAIRDISRVVRRRYPGMPVILYPTLVQGEKAVDTVVEGIRELNKRKDIDVIVVTRGGGSSEDLNVFNSEKVADAIFDSNYPVISAIGHEIDFTVADMVADIRAATPSMAGELAVPVKDDIKMILNKQRNRLFQLINNYIDKERMRIKYLSESGFLKRPDRWLDRYRDDLGKKEEKLYQVINTTLDNYRYSISLNASKLHSLSPLATLARGYSICKNEKEEILKDLQKISIGEKIDIQLYSGNLRCEVLEKGDKSNESRG
ncbi:MAG: exodeoxyribonuclease VII large subunit [Clostridia bacterium]|nr:exodeoxyribonuclease VII large subunit [Clostridia bacterium]MDD4048869.1 exodeoxyribonuclease VII large subunit [Clostridia bacterium]